MNEPSPLQQLIYGLAVLLAAAAPGLQAQTRTDVLRPGDYIVAVVNSELVTAGEVQQRLSRAQREAARSSANTAAC